MSGLLTALGIASGIGAAAKGVAGMTAAAQQFTREDKERLQRLRRLEALNQLGLSSNEEALLERELLQPINTGRREAQADLMEAQSIQDVGAANTARTIQTLEEQANEARAQAMANIQEADQLRAQQQRAERSALEEQQRARRVGMATAGIGAVSDLAQVAVQQQKAKMDAANQKAMMQMLQAKSESDAQSTAYLDESTVNQLLMLQLLNR